MTNYLKRLWSPHSPRRTVVLAVAGPGLVTLLALLDTHVPATTAAVLYVLAVVVAAAAGGAWAGVGASLVSFLALNFFFTPPLRTFTVGSSSDFAALVVFLIVSVIVGILFSTTLSAKRSAERREQQARLLNHLATGLLSGEATEDVLKRLADELIVITDAARCEIDTVLTRPIVAEATDRVAPGEPFEVPITTRGRPIGTLRVTRRPSMSRFDQEEHELVEVLAAQLALVLESTRLHDEVRRAQLEAEASRLRAVLFSGVTHDLKTPLAAITASVTSLLDDSGFSDQERYEHLDTIRQEAERLHRVVNNLLDLSRLRAGTLVPSKVASSIDELIENVIARLRSLLAGRDVDIQVREQLPDVPMDVVQIDQVLTNLIENAVKFSPPGSPLSVSVVGHPKGVRVTVVDHGPGIPKEERNRMFQPFQTGRAEGAGTGLGLAISKAIVEAHRGRMWMHEPPGGGTAMTFELPCEQETSTREVAESAGASSGRR